MSSQAAGREGNKVSTLTSRRVLPYVLVLPSLAVLLALIVYPLLFSITNSFRLWNLQTSPQPLGFVGIQNYKLVFTTTPFNDALRNTLLLSVLGTFIEFWFGIGVALLLATRVRGTNVARALLIMPCTIAPIVAGFLFRYMYYERGGVLTWLLQTVGFPVPIQGLLGNPNTALAAIALADIWQWTPFFAIVLYAALIAIPEEVVEAAIVDGAAGLSMFRHITLPSISRTAVIVIMIRFMQLFNMFDLVLVLTRGGPGTASRTLSYNLYQEGLVNYNIGVAAAMTFLIVIIVTILINLYSRVAFRNWEW
jgi:multiple sugar transport system permease protein